MPHVGLILLLVAVATSVVGPAPCRAAEEGNGQLFVWSTDTPRSLHFPDSDTELAVHQHHLPHLCSIAAANDGLAGPVAAPPRPQVVFPPDLRHPPAALLCLRLLVRGDSPAALKATTAAVARAIEGASPRLSAFPLAPAMHNSGGGGGNGEAETLVSGSAAVDAAPQSPSPPQVDCQSGAAITAWLGASSVPQQLHAVLLPHEGIGPCDALLLQWPQGYRGTAHELTLRLGSERDRQLLREVLTLLRRSRQPVQSTAAAAAAAAAAATTQVEYLTIESLQTRFAEDRTSLLVWALSKAIAGMASSSAGSAGLVMVHPSTSSGTNSRHLAADESHRGLAASVNATRNYTESEITDFQVMLWVALLLAASLVAVVCVVAGAGGTVRDPLLYSQFQSQYDKTRKQH